MKGSAMDSVQPPGASPRASLPLGGTALPAGGSRSPSPPAPAAPAPTRDYVLAVVERLNEFMSQSQRSVRFRVDESSGRTVITVLNPQTQEVVRQIPSEEMIALSRWLDTTGRGVVLQAYA